MGDFKPMDLPFLFPQSRIFRAYNLTADLNMRYGADIRLISVKLQKCMYSQYISTWASIDIMFLVCLSAFLLLILLSSIYWAFFDKASNNFFHSKPSHLLHPIFP